MQNFDAQNEIPQNEIPSIVVTPPDGTEHEGTQNEIPQNEIPSIVVTPPDGTEHEGTEHEGTEHEGTEHEGTQTEGTQTEKETKSTDYSKSRAKAAGCINAAAPLINLIGKDMGGNVGVEIAQGITAALTSALTEDPTAMVGFVINLIAPQPDPKLNLLETIERQTKEILKDVKDLTSYTVDTNLQNNLGIIHSALKGIMENQIAIVSSPELFEKFRGDIYESTRMLAKMAVDTTTFCDNFWNNYVFGKSIQEVITNYNSYFGKISEAFLQASQVAAMLKLINPETTIINDIQGYYNQYKKAVESQLSYIPYIAGKINGGESFNIQLVNCAEPNKILYSNAGTNFILTLDTTDNINRIGNWGDTVILYSSLLSRVIFMKDTRGYLVNDSGNYPINISIFDRQLVSADQLGPCFSDNNTMSLCIQQGDGRYWDNYQRTGFYMSNSCYKDDHKTVVEQRWYPIININQ